MANSLLFPLISNSLPQHVLTVSTHSTNDSRAHEYLLHIFFFFFSFTKLTLLCGQSSSAGLSPATIKN